MIKKAPKSLLKRFIHLAEATQILRQLLVQTALPGAQTVIDASGFDPNIIARRNGLRRGSMVHRG
jgi:hypothetical protein